MTKQQQFQAVWGLLLIAAAGIDYLVIVGLLRITGLLT